MKREYIIHSLLDQARDKDLLADGDETSIFTEDAKALREAVALLKAQKPRVMTLEEYKAWMDIPFCERDPILLEMKSRRGTETWWTNTAECSIENYGKTERCWTSRPTDEQREAEPWE